MLDTPDDVQEWLEATSRTERSHQLSALSKPQLTTFASSLSVGAGAEVLRSVDADRAATVLRAGAVAHSARVLKKLKLDPAVVSAPMISTIVDGTGMLIYFWIVHLTLSQLQGL